MIIKMILLFLLLLLLMMMMMMMMMLTTTIIFLPFLFVKKICCEFPAVDSKQSTGPSRGSAMGQPLSCCCESTEDDRRG